MKSLYQYITESKYPFKSDDIKFVIYEKPDTKVTRLKSNTEYQKIEYEYRDKKDEVNVDFLLGFTNNTWKLWCGKIGGVTYDDDPYCSFDTQSFDKAIVLSINKIKEILKDIYDNPKDWVQYYIHR